MSEVTKQRINEIEEAIAEGTVILGDGFSFYDSVPLYRTTSAWTEAARKYYATVSDFVPSYFDALTLHPAVPRSYTVPPDNADAITRAVNQLATEISVNSIASTEIAIGWIEQMLIEFALVFSRPMLDVTFMRITGEECDDVLDAREAQGLFWDDARLLWIDVSGAN